MMTRTMDKRSDPVLGRLRRAGFPAAVLALLLAGCAHAPQAEKSEFIRVYTPQVPVFLTGPMGVLLTNNGGFSARATVRGDSAFAASELVEGELLGRGSKLLFAPRETGQEGKQLRVGGFSYIWDVASGTGFVLSDALQGYAPVASSLRATNLVLGATGGAWREATAFLNDGAQAIFRIWPSGSRRPFPSRIELLGVPPLALSFSKVKLEAPPADLFAPPDGFTGYRSAEALANEIAARQYNLRRGPLEPALPAMRPTPGRGY